MKNPSSISTAKKILQKSKAKQSDVNNLVKMAKKGRWERTRQKIGL